MVELEFISIRGISEDNVVELCELAESVVRSHIFSRIPRRQILDLDVTIEADLNEALTITIDIDVTLSPFFQGNLEEIEEEAIEKAFKIIERRLREFSGFEGKEV